MNYKYKQDKDKPRLDLVPPGIIEAVGIIRTYRVEKYGENTNWEKVADRPVSFMEAVESGKKIKVEHDFIDDDIGYLKENYTFLGDMLWELGESLSTDGVQDVIMNGKFYIED